MRIATKMKPVIFALAASLCAIPLVVAQAPAGAAPDAIVDIPVSFQVQNANHTLVACTSDNKIYTVRGHITGPSSAVYGGDAATLYLHAVTQGEFYWRFNGVPGYNYVQQQAANGHVSVTIDRLGYGASGKPAGYGSCFGSQATVAHEVIQDLRTGSYQIDTGSAPSFNRVFLAGHSAGGLTATIEAYSFNDVAGLIDFAWADAPPTVFTALQLANTQARCLLGGDKGTPNYAAFGTNKDKILFYSATPEVRAAVPAPAADPCGDITSITAGIVADTVGVSTTKAPVLLVFGENDALFPVAAARLQKARYLSSSDVTLDLLPNTSHAALYEATHLQAVAAVDKWLTDRNA